MELLWGGGTKVCANSPGHMTKMASMPIYGKNLKKPKRQWPWNLVCSIGCSNIFYAPNLEDVDWAYWFLVVRACVRASLHQELCLLGFWNFIYGFHMEKKLTIFFFLSELSPFLELCPFEKIWMKSDACHILQTMHARVLKFHIWVPHGKIADP